MSMSDRADLAEARRFAEMSPQQRYDEIVGRRQGSEQLGDRVLSDTEYETLTFGEKKLYAARRSGKR